MRIHPSILLFFFLAATLPATAQEKKQPVAVIFDTDMGPDYDDVGAIALLHALADSGEAKILATVASTRYEGVAAILNAFNTYFGRPGLPIGVPKGAAVDLKDWQHWTDTVIARYPHVINRNSEVEDAVALYRRVLAAQPDQSVSIITVGFLTNLADLLRSGPDAHSPLSGKDLIRKKVFRLYSMAGRFPEGKEFNIEKDAAAGRYVAEHWPRPIVFSGWEIGSRILSGLPLVQQPDIRNSPVKDVFRIALPMAKEDSAGRMSWDQTAVLVAVRGWHPWYGTKEGTIAVAADGSNRWTSGKGPHLFLQEARPPSEAEAVINRLMLHQPVPHKQ
ncbi:MAG TPA: nucleoside hydrolase [Chitinophagaceae bacterium]|jgi:inosine-uridine nucleoside N-ribohydrolase|nr:nucleoside hydrolase [Chitinophagaceae bacterium]